MPGGAQWDDAWFSVPLAGQRPPFSWDSSKRKFYVFLGTSSPGRQPEPFLRAYWGACGRWRCARRRSAAGAVRGAGSRRLKSSVSYRQSCSQRRS